MSEISRTPQQQASAAVGEWSAVTPTKRSSDAGAPAKAVGILRTLLLGAGLLAVFALPAVAQTGDVPVDLELTVLSAIVLGLVEGLTEYLPVSSTGHLLVTNELMGLNVSDEAERLLDTYAIGIQAGAILAVFVVYRERVKQMIDGLLGRSEEGRQILIALVVSFVPTALIAVVLFEAFREYIFGPIPIAAAWIVGGVAILALTRIGFFDRIGSELGTITVKQAALIGVLQTAAVWPGTSRSLVTIIAGILVGLNLRSAVEYSFLLGLVTLSAATAYAGLKDGSELVAEFGVVTPLIGLVVAFVSAVLAVQWMVSWLNDKGFDVFGWYRIAAGIALLLLVGVGTVNA